MSKQADVYTAINNVQAALSKVGIAKEKFNKQGEGYKFRGIDDVMNALSPLLSDFGLVILPTCLERTQEERQSRNGGALFYTTVKVQYDFISVSDGTSHSVTTYGEAMDSGDKSTNKAMSAAYKYACFQAFCIPVPAPDADKFSPEVKPKKEVVPTIHDNDDFE